MLYLEHCFIWLRDLDTKKIEALKCGSEGEYKIICLDKVTNEQVLERVGENRTLLNNILIWIGHILRINCLLRDDIEGQMTEVGRKRAQLLDYLKNRRRYLEVMEEAEDRKS